MKRQVGEVIAERRDGILHLLIDPPIGTMGIDVRSVLDAMDDVLTDQRNEGYKFTLIIEREDV